MSTVDQQILLAASAITTYVGGLMFILGTVGNTMNILAFCCLKAYRPLSTPAFLATASCSWQLYITCTLFLSSLSNIIGYNPAARDSILCKMVLFISRVTVQIALTCLCLSAIDRYLMTSRSALYRAFITRKRACFAICICIVIWSCYGIPNILYSVNYSLFNICIPSQEFTTTLTYLNLVFAVLLPIMILSLFSLLTWKNLARARLSSFNVQITKMILLDVLVVIISNVPLGFFLIYAVTNSANRLFTPVETLAIYLVQLTTAFQSVSSFYFYLLISPVYRSNIKAMLCKVVCCWKPTMTQVAAPLPISSHIPLRIMTNVHV